MLHLQAGVHFDEIEPAIFVKEFNRAGAAIAELFHGFAQIMPISSRWLVVRSGEGASSKNFLVAALQGTVAFPEMGDIAVRIGDHCNFDVARP